MQSALRAGLTLSVLSVASLVNAQEARLTGAGPTDAAPTNEGEAESSLSSSPQEETPVASPAVEQEANPMQSTSTYLPRGNEEEAPAPEEEVAEPAAPASSNNPFDRGRFEFGSYGRIIGASDLQGRTGRQNRIVAFAPRVDEDDTYAEIELRREDHMFGLDSRIVATVAYAGPLFHYDGEFSERIAIRNLFADVSNVFTRGLGVWAGSRMVRGDDVYLLNFWPLDNLNLLGGGARYVWNDGDISLAVGSSQPNDPFQRQTALYPARAGIVADEVFVLDRPRLISALRGTYYFNGRTARNGAKAVLYGEQHFLAAGERNVATSSVTAPVREAVPEDSGFVLGGQLGAYMADSRTFLNVFGRYARGLAAYDPLGVPFRNSTTVITTGRAEELRIAAAGNFEVHGPDLGFGVQVGTNFRYFRDADPSVFDRGSLTEFALTVRPHLFVGDIAGVALDLSAQHMEASRINEVTGRAEQGNLFKIGVLPFISPFGRGTYMRPHIRLIYTLSIRDDNARALYNSADARSMQNVDHFLGIGVEWWFNSSSYAP